ncbi:MAG: metal-dependent transcriptional regulator [Succinivibrionaceae bacterium]|jgi:Mn-dependent DtxR family transcriptional regulator|nr:metal-dependent transcriptional regulator [Succinivibrionaceae bacterium]MBQ1426404.1 metal-dependent transcriptional regulator [Succinivibrionaceae bacterium]
MHMLESGENYLETILILNEKNNGKVKSIDLAKELNFSKPSVSRAVSILKNEGYIKVESSGYLILTEAGMAKAQMIYDRHKTLTKLFSKIANVTPEVAEKDACRIEHVISNETFYGLKTFLARLEEKESDQDK